MDFASLLKGLTKDHVDSISNSPWADLAVGKRRPNAPPALQLTPSQQAVDDLHKGITEQAQWAKSAPTEQQGYSESSGVPFDKHSDPYYNNPNYGQPANTDPAYAAGAWRRITDQVGNNIGAQMKLSLSAGAADSKAHKLAKETGQPFNPSPPGLVAGSGDMGLSDEQIKNITADDWKYNPQDWQNYSRPGTQSSSTPSMQSAPAMPSAQQMPSTPSTGITPVAPASIPSGAMDNPAGGGFTPDASSIGSAMGGGGLGSQIAGVMGSKGMQGLQGALHSATDSKGDGGAMAPIDISAPVATPQYTYQPIQMRAQGGPIDPRAITIVGDPGPNEEAIINNQVIPPAQTQQLLANMQGQAIPAQTAAMPVDDPNIGIGAQTAAMPVQTDTPQQIAQRNTTPVEAMPVGATPLATQPQPQEALIPGGTPVTSTTGATVPPATAATPVDVPDPHDVANQSIQSAADQARQAQIDARNAPVDPNIKHSKWKNLGIALATSAYNATHPQDIQRVKNYGDWKKDRAIEQADSKAAQIGGIQTAQTIEELKQANIDNILGKNPTAIAKAKIAAETAANNQKIKARREWYLSHRSFDGSKATPAERAELATFGETPETMDKYDYTDPKVHTVAGKAFKMNPRTGQYDAKEVLDNPNEASVAITVTDPHGIDHTYNVPSKEAATIQAGLAKTGMVIKGAADRNTATIQGRKDVATANQEGAIFRATAKTPEQVAAFFTKIDTGVPKNKGENDQQYKMRLHNLKQEYVDNINRNRPANQHIIVNIP